MVQCLYYLLIQTDDHDVRPNVEFIAPSRLMRLVCYPETAVHIRNSDALNIGRAPGHTVFHELQKDLVKAARFIMGSFGTTRKTAPPACATPENAELAAERSRPVEHRCILRDKLWTCPHRGCDLLPIGLRNARCWHLSVGESRDEY